MEQAIKQRYAGSAPPQQDDPPQENARPLRKFILVACRDLTTRENQILNKHFPQVIVYHDGLNSSEMDLSKMTFDLLVIDERRPENHRFLEIIARSAKELCIPRVVLGRKYSCCKDLAKALGATYITRIEDHEGENFFRYLEKDELPKMQNRFIVLMKRLFALLSR